MKRTQWIPLAAVCLLAAACGGLQTKEEKVSATTAYEKGTFGYDAGFLRRYDSNLVLLRNGSARVAVSASYQGKVFTSSASGDGGVSYGWINYKAFDAEPDAHMNAFGGENRFWLGPEGGKYSVFFRKGDSMVFNNWKTPAPIDTEAWIISAESDTSVTMNKEIRITNYAGTTLNMKAERTVSIADAAAVSRELNVEPDSSVQFVGYHTFNKITNTGEKAWNEETGMPCIWILDMFNPSPETTIVVPFSSEGKGKIATTDYFGEIDKDRLKITDSTLFFRADGKSRGKLGIVPVRVLPFAGSFDAASNVLTITKFSTDRNGKYLNQEWNTLKPVFSGDAMNAYNDGPLEDGSQMGPFYEIESVSPAAALEPGAAQEHFHHVYHFSGNRQKLNEIALKLLGVSLEEIEKVFNR